jgi:hypothetical protein
MKRTTVKIIVRARSALLEKPQLIRQLVSKIVPLLFWVEMDLDVLDDMAWEDLVTRNKIFLGIHCRSIAHGERPVSQRTLKRFPDAVQMSEWHFYNNCQYGLDALDVMLCHA